MALMVATPTCHIGRPGFEFWLFSPFKLLLVKTLGGKVDDSKNWVLTTHVTYMEFPNSDFTIDQPWLSWAFRE